MKHKFIYLLCITILGIVCLSCQNREAYYHFCEFKGAKWGQNDTVYFEIDSADLLANVPYEVTIELENRTDYAYQNLCLYAKDNLGDSCFSSKKLEYKIADEKGKWLGAGYGTSFQISLPYKQRLILTEQGNYTLKIVQRMQDEPLLGIERIGLRIAQIED